MRYLRNVYEPVGIVSPGAIPNGASSRSRSEEHTSELQSRSDLVCRLLLEKKKNAFVLGAKSGGVMRLRHFITAAGFAAEIPTGTLLHLAFGRCAVTACGREFSASTLLIVD